MFSIDWIYTTARLEPINYVRKPQVLLRLITVILAIVNIAVVHNDCYIYGKCLFNEDQASCGYSLFLSSLTFIACSAYLWLDLIVDNVSNIDIRLRVAKFDMLLSGIWFFLWLIAFCLLCNRWQNTEQDFLTHNDASPVGPRTVIAFTFFSMVVLVILGFFTYKSYKSTEIQCSNLAYGEPDNSGSYRGFANDADMLNPSGPGLADPDTPVSHSNFNYRAGLTDVYPGHSLGGYQP
ncbi:unnamed protein product [Schistosoma turkestanicum]|nr:unnamed protein product [Schistosoma turkestanicum]